MYAYIDGQTSSTSIVHHMIRGSFSSPAPRPPRPADADEGPDPPAAPATPAKAARVSSGEGRLGRSQGRGGILSAPSVPEASPRHDRCYLWFRQISQIASRWLDTHMASWNVEVYEMLSRHPMATCPKGSATKEALDRPDFGGTGRIPRPRHCTCSHVALVPFERHEKLWRCAASLQSQRSNNLIVTRPSVTDYLPRVEVETTCFYQTDT